MTRLLAFALLLLTACGNPLQTDDAPPTLYRLNAAPAQESPRRSLIVEVARPELAEGLDTDRIALVEGGRRQQYFADGRWPGDLGDVLQDFLVASLDHAGVTAVESGAAPVTAQYRLVPKVDAFQAEYRGSLQATPTSKTAMQFLLLSVPDNRIVGEVKFAEEHAVSGNNLTAIVDALEQSAQMAVQGLVEDLSTVP